MPFSVDRSGRILRGFLGVGLLAAATGRCAAKVVSPGDLLDAGTPFPDGGSTESPDATGDSRTEADSDAPTDLGNDATTPDISYGSEGGNDVASPDDGGSADACQGSCGPHQTCTAGAGTASCRCAVDPTCSAPGDVCTSTTSLVECVTDDQGCTYAFSTSTCSACPHGCLVTMLSQRPDGAITIDGMVVGARGLYCLNEEATEVVLSVPLRGGPATLLAQDARSSGLAVDSTGVYSGGPTDGGDGALVKTPLEGGPTTILATGSWPQAIALDSTDVYWADTASPPGFIRKIAIDGGAAIALQSGVSPQELAVGPANVYWLGGQEAGDAGEAYGLFATPLDGGAPIMLWSLPPDLPGGGTGGIAVDAEYVYWVMISSDPTLGAVMRMPLDGGTATTVAVGSSPFWVAVDEAGVYWTGQVGSVGVIMKAPLTNGTPGPPITLASGFGVPFYIGVDSTSVYFYNAANEASMNAIMRVTK
jgi:hypothetical protein